MLLPLIPLLLQKPTILLHVDATEANRGVIYVHETIPVTAGHSTLYYPKWIPGEHQPSGPIQGLVQLEFRSGGQILSWKRDPVEMFRFDVDVPAGANQVDASFMFISTPGDTFTPNLARINWNRLVLSTDRPSDELLVREDLKMPPGWKAASALWSPNGETTATATLTQLIDSPAIIGRHETDLDLGAVVGKPVSFHLFSDAERPNFPDSTAKALKNVPREFEALFNSRHFRHYDFLTSLSDSGGGAGLEHHESSEDGLGANQMVDDPVFSGYIFTHEFFHSWNGKFRRPRGLATPDYLKPMQGELLWVYEGLTQYYGFVLAARTGLISKEQFNDVVAGYWNMLDTEPGRKWRSVADTAVSVQLTFTAPDQYVREIRRPDFYFEGLLVWMEADCLIRIGTQGDKSLDDF